MGVVGLVRERERKKMIDSNNNVNMSHHNPNFTGTKEVVVEDEESPLLALPLLRNREEDEQGSGSKASVTGSVFNLSTTIIGAGIMALPAAIKVVGVGVGVVAIVFLAFLTHTSLEILLRFTRVAKASTYANLMGDAFGSSGTLLFHLSVLINNFGILVVYVIIIGDVLSGTSSSGVHHFGVLEGWFGQCWWTARTFVLLLTTLFVFAPLGFFKRIGTYTTLTLHYYVMASNMLHILEHLQCFMSCLKLSTLLNKFFPWSE